MNIGNIDMNGGYLGSEEVIKCYQGNTVVWEQSSGSPIDYLSMPLTFEILSDGYVYSRKNYSGTKTLEYRLNDGEWTSHTNTTNNTDVKICDVKQGDRVQFRGNNNTYAQSNYQFFKLRSTADFNIMGNIMSLVDSTGYTTATTLTGSYCFGGLFTPSNTADQFLKDISHLMLPATTLSQGCYYQMFYTYRSISGAAPELPATTLTNSCYFQMFYGGDFGNHNNINYIKCLATDISASNCTKDWVGKTTTGTMAVAATGTFVTPSTTNWSTGASGIPSGWTRVNSDTPQYTQLEYIQTNFEYFNTQIVPDSDIKVVLDFELTSFDGGYGNNGIFGSWTNGYDAGDTLAFFANSDRSEFSYYCGGGYEDYAGNYTLGNRYTVELDGNECVITEDGGVPQQYVIGLTATQGTTPILLGCVYPNPDDNPEPTNIKIYEGWIYNGNTLIAHYLPYYDNYNNCNVLKDAVSNTYLSPWTYTPTV